MYANSYLQSTRFILLTYKGEIPFASWLKNYFKQHKKFGSRDRKAISQLCFGFFRLGNAFSSQPIEERILIGLFLTSQEPHFVLSELKPEWNSNIHFSAIEKLKWLEAIQESIHFFPYPEQISEEINKEAFRLSHLIQPLLYLRIRPGKEKKVMAQLDDSGIAFEAREENCLALPNSTKATDVLMINRDVVVQDLNSQKVLDILPTELFHQPLAAWDCCAASGGKSILLYDKNPKVQLTVSDVRESIIINLKKRFAEAGIHPYKSLVTDVAKPGLSQPTSTYQLVVCDAPCSGSGTWGRTPEQLCFFTKDKLQHYTSLQKSIAKNAAQAVQKGGWFLYITCSVFAAENEEVVSYLQQNTSLQLHAVKYFKGWNKRADTLFAAAFFLP